MHTIFADDIQNIFLNLILMLKWKCTSYFSRTLYGKTWSYAIYNQNNTTEYPSIKRYAEHMSTCSFDLYRTKQITQQLHSSNHGVTILFNSSTSTPLYVFFMSNINFTEHTVAFITFFFSFEVNIYFLF
jgi:hypothetical protein